MPDQPPPVVQDLLTRWDSLSPEIRDRLQRAGYGPVAPSTEPGVGTTAAEAVGGGLGAAGGRFLGGRAGAAVGAGLGSTAGGAVADYFGGRPASGRAATTRGVTGGVFEAVGRPVAEGVSAASRRVLGAVARRVPSMTKVIEWIAPGAAGTGERVAAEVGKVGTASSLRQAGEAAQGGIQGAYEGWRAQAKGLFDAVEQATGDELLVPTENLRREAGSLLKLQRAEPAGAMAAAGRAKGAGEPVTEMQFRGRGREATSTELPELDPLGPTGYGGPPAPAEGVSTQVFQGEYAGQAPELVDLYDAVQKPYITFGQARRIESQLGRMAYHQAARAARSRGLTMRERDATVLLDAVRSDMDTFFATDLGQSVKPQLGAAKEVWKQGKQLFEESIVGKLRKLPPEKIIGQVFRPGNIAETLAFKKAAPAAFDDALATWLDHTWQLSQQNPRAFAKLIGKYEATGHLQYLVGPERQEALLSLAEDFGHIGGHGGPMATAARYAGRGALLGLGAGESGAIPGYERHGMPGLAGLGMLLALDPTGRAALGPFVPQVAGRLLEHHLDPRSY